MNKINSVLILQKLIFDKIEFQRTGFKNTNELTFGFTVERSLKEDGNHKITLIFKGEKEDEYNILISISGYFAIEDNGELDEKRKEDLLNKNTVAILMPYLRSEITLLTAQPDTESIVLPPFNINKMMSNKENSDGIEKA